MSNEMLMMIIDKKILSIAIIFALVSILALSNASQISLAKTNKDNASTKTQTSSNKNMHSTGSIINDMDKMQFQQFGTCVGLATGKDNFATEKDVQNCFIIVYGSDPSSIPSSSTTSSHGHK